MDFIQPLSQLSKFSGDPGTADSDLWQTLLCLSRESLICPMFFNGMKMAVFKKYITIFIQPVTSWDLRASRSKLSWCYMYFPISSLQVTEIPYK